MDSKFVIKKRWKEAGASNTQGHENYKEPSIFRGGESRIQYMHSKYRLYTNGMTCDNCVACDNITMM